MEGLRDRFAAEAMAALLKNDELDTSTAEQVAVQAYEMADAMIEMRSESSPRWEEKDGTAVRSLGNGTCQER